MYSIENLPGGAEPIFHIQYNDIAERYYRLRLDGADYIYFNEVTRISSGKFQQYYRLDSWESCWHCFLKGFETDSWTAAQALYIHEDYRHFIQSALLSEVIKKSSQVRTSFIEEWKRALQVAAIK